MQDSPNEALVAEAKPSVSRENDLVWGAAAIGEVIDRSAAQVYHLVSVGALKGAVRKVAHKTLVGSRRELLRLPLGEGK